MAYNIQYTIYNIRPCSLSDRLFRVAAMYVISRLSAHTYEHTRTRESHSMRARASTRRQARFYDACKLFAAAHALQFGGSALPDPNVRPKCGNLFENDHHICKIGTKTRVHFSKNVHGWVIASRAKIQKGDRAVWPKIQADIIKYGIGELLTIPK